MAASTLSTFAVITGGGTSGHVVPAIAIAELLVDSGHETASLHYVGSATGVEASMIPQVGMLSTLLEVDGLQRGVSLSKIKRNIRMVFVMLRANRTAKHLLEQLQPQVVVSVGGYASIPTCRAARQLKIPVVTCSYDRSPGLATRVQSRYAYAAAVAYGPSALPRAIVTGAPVRRSLRTAQLSKSRNQSREAMGIALSDRVVVVMGGSLGSAVLNSATQYLVHALQSNQHTCVIHIAGERYMKSVGLAEVITHQNGHLAYQRLAYCHDMVGLYSAADVVVCRAGASTIAEIATVGVCAVVIPWKDAAENHQLINAQWLTHQDAAVLIEESSLTDHGFATAVETLLLDDDRRARIAANAFSAGLLHRNSSIVDVVQSAAQSKGLR